MFKKGKKFTNNTYHNEKKTTQACLDTHGFPELFLLDTS